LAIGPIRVGIDKLLAIRETKVDKTFNKEVNNLPQYLNYLSIKWSKSINGNK